MLCHADNEALIRAGVAMMQLVDTEVDIRTHSVCQSGHCYLMRHPEDFTPIHPFEFDVTSSEQDTA